MPCRARHGWDGHRGSRRTLAVLDVSVETTSSLKVSDDGCALIRGKWWHSVWTFGIRNGSVLGQVVSRRKAGRIVDGVTTSGMTRRAQSVGSVLKGQMRVTAEDEDVWVGMGTTQGLDPIHMEATCLLSASKVLTERRAPNMTLRPRRRRLHHKFAVAAPCGRVTCT